MESVALANKKHIQNFPLSKKFDPTSIPKFRPHRKDLERFDTSLETSSWNTISQTVTGTENFERLI